MKRIPGNKLYNLNQAAAAALSSKKALMAAVFFFLTGISTGLFLELTMASADKAGLAGYLTQYLYTDSGSMEYPNPFFSSLVSNLLLLAIIFLAGLSAVGFPVAFAALIYKGMALGFCTGLIFETLENNGLFVVLTSLVPQNLILIPSFILAAAAAANYGLRAFQSYRRPSKKNPKDASGPYILLILLLCLSIGLACGLEAILYPVVLSP